VVPVRAVVHEQARLWGKSPCEKRKLLVINLITMFCAKTKGNVSKGNVALGLSVCEGRQITRCHGNITAGVM